MNNNLVIDFLALQARITIRNSNTPKAMNAISIILNAPKVLHIQIAKAASPMASNPNTRLRILRTKNKQVLPLFL